MKEARDKREMQSRLRQGRPVMGVPTAIRNKHGSNSTQWQFSAGFRRYFDTRRCTCRFRSRATGDVIIVRYADDIVAGFEHEADASRFLDAMCARFEEFALSLHPDKTRLIEFGRHAAADRAQRGLGKPETFKFLGFTFICGKPRAGKFLIHRKSRRDRVRVKLKEGKEEPRWRMHGPIREQAEWLRQVVNGFFNYHAVPTNLRALVAFRYHVIDLWRRTLRRRGQKHRMTWEQIGKLADDRLPKPRILTPGRTNASPSNTQGGSRMRESRSYGFVRGALSNGRPYRNLYFWHCNSLGIANRLGPLVARQIG